MTAPRTVHDADARPEVCTRPGHIKGCPGAAGGDHERVRVRHRAPTWTAARDGIGHATQGSAPRTLCGLVTLPERHGYPVVHRCPICDSLAVRGA